VDTTPILTAPWPDALDPSDVLFTKRTVTVLERQGIYTNPTLLSELTTTDVLGWWNAGPATVEDLRIVGNDAIRRHHTETGLLKSLEADLSDMASASWAPHIWYHDPRFARFVPKGELTVYQVATAGSGADRRFLWEQGKKLRDAVDAQGRLSLLVAVSQYVEAVSGQHGERLEVLLARTGLNGRDPITGAQAARRLGVSHQRMSQIVGQLYRARDRACPPEGIWMPQLDAVDETGQAFFRRDDRADMGASESLRVHRSDEVPTR
jgi:hypothetical protein